MIFRIYAEKMDFSIYILFKRYNYIGGHRSRVMQRCKGLALKRCHDIRPDSATIKHVCTRRDHIPAASGMEIAGRRSYKENIGVIPVDMEDHQMISTNNSKVTRLEPWMEVIGPFIELVEKDGVLLAEIAKHIVVLPLELKETLSVHLGHRIAILRTDIPGKEYLFRVLPKQDQSESAAMANELLANMARC